MARRSVIADAEENTEINLSSMIDCIFILLIFFIVTTVFVEETGLDVNKPDSSAASASDEENTSVVFEITQTNKILFEGNEIALSEVKNRVKDNMEDEETPVIIRAHATARHGLFLSVWDQASLAGARQLSFTTINN